MKEYYEAPCRECDGDGRLANGHPNDPEAGTRRCPCCDGHGGVVYCPKQDGLGVEDLLSVKANILYEDAHAALVEEGLEPDEAAGVLKHYGYEPKPVLASGGK